MLVLYLYAHDNELLFWRSTVITVITCAQYHKWHFIQVGSQVCNSSVLVRKLRDRSGDKSSLLKAAIQDAVEFDVSPLDDCWSTFKTFIYESTESAVAHVERNLRIVWLDKKLLRKKTCIAWTLMLQHGIKQNMVEQYNQKWNSRSLHVEKERTERIEPAPTESMTKSVHRMVETTPLRMS